MNSIPLKSSLRWFQFLTGASLFIVAGCLGKDGSPVVSTSSNGSVTLKSSAYANSAARLSSVQLAESPLVFASATVSDFKFCVTKLKLKNSEGTAVTQDGAESIEAILGLIDVSNSSGAATWGQVKIPVGFTLSELSIEIHKDPENCSSAQYSLSYNGTSLTKDLEFKFKFNPAVSVVDGDTLTLALTSIASAIEQASAAGKLTNESIGEYLTTEVEGSGSK